MSPEQTEMVPLPSSGEMEPNSSMHRGLCSSETVLLSPWSPRWGLRRAESQRPGVLNVSAFTVMTPTQLERAEMEVLPLMVFD